MLKLCIGMLAAACGGLAIGGDGRSIATIDSISAAVPVAAQTAKALAGTADDLGHPHTLPNSKVVATVRTLSATATLQVVGVPDAPTPAPPLPNGGGRSFFVDNRNGDDGNNGRQISTGAAGAGPWKTLTRIMQSDLGPGDNVVLACGSAWRETLRLPANGTASRPISVGAPVTGCGAAALPSIDGSVAIQARSWTLHSGKIYKATVDGPVLGINSTLVGWNEAAHPNRGHLASEPGSPYLVMAADGNVVAANGRSGSTTLVSGPDLVLPEGVRLVAGIKLRARSNSWTLEESVLAGATGKTLTLQSPTRYPLLAGWGYYLAGALWMLDSPGEWQYDTLARQLYAWMPDSAAPTATIRATVLPTGIDLESREYVRVDGVAVRRVGLGINLRRSKGVLVRNSSIEDVAGAGADVAASNAVTFESNTLARTGSDGIGSSGIDGTPAAQLTARNNVLRDSGVLMQGEQPIGMPLNSRGAIVAGNGARISGNVVINAGYIGIRVRSDSVVEDNLVYGACSVLDDCGGIYVYVSSGVRIRGNTVVRSRGAIQGKAAAKAYTQAQGIYLDESTFNTTVQDNTVIDTDNGIQLHVAHNNTIRGNRLYANRQSQIRMYESRKRDNSNGDLYGNVVEDNQLIAIDPQSVALLLQTRFAATSAFASFDRNRYYDRGISAVAVETTAAGTRAFNMAQWQQSRSVGSPIAADVNGSDVGNTGYAAYSVIGPNLVPNSALAVNTAGWTHWNATAPAGQLVRETCPSGTCLRYVAGGSAGLVATPAFPVQQGQQYRLSVDLLADADMQPLQIAVRRTGSNGSGKESVIGPALAVTAGRTWARHTLVFQATHTVIAGDPATGDLGARVSVSAIPAGRTVSLANLEVVPISANTLAQTSGALINVGGAAVKIACPFAASKPALCARLNTLVDGRAATWPLPLQPHSAAIVYAQDPTLLDSDRDGIADTQDRCPDTAPGVAVNAAGCAWPVH